MTAERGRLSLTTLGGLVKHRTLVEQEWFLRRMGGRVPLRWIYVHMIEQTARHADHLDILREQVDALGSRS